MVLTTGEKIHTITRRLFETDVRRHFVGEVQAVADGLARIRGYAFVFESSGAGFTRKPEPRTRVIPLCDADLIINVIPQSVAVDELKYEMIEGHLVMTDGKGFTLDINEFGAMR